MSATENKFILSNGMEVPCIGFGTYNAKGGDNLKMIKDAIEVGYRYFDTASLYGTERALGQAIKESGIPRDQFIIASKVWIDEMGYENTKAALHRSLSRLQTDYLDFYLIHWPKPKETDEGWKELDLETWRSMWGIPRRRQLLILRCRRFWCRPGVLLPEVSCRTIP